MKRLYLLMFLVFGALRSAHALAITAPALNNYTITGETTGLTGTTIQFTLDVVADVQVQIFKASDLTTPVTTISQNGMAAAADTIFWNGLWFLGGDMGRQDGNYIVAIVATAGGNTVSAAVVNPLVITSVDIHNVSFTPSLDANQSPVFPFLVQYALAKDALVTVQIKDASNVVVRTLASNAPQVNETAATHTLLWDGLDNNAHLVPLAVYTVVVNAHDSNGTDVAFTRSRSLAVQSLASLSTSPQQQFEANTFIYPNPVRAAIAAGDCGSPACFQYMAVRDNATINLKVYTISGDLVLDKTFGNLSPGVIQRFAWNAVNQSGHAIGRGLYYYVIREIDPAGTLQSVKKLAVIK